MKTIAIVDGGYASPAFYREYFDRLRGESGADKLLVITDGDLNRQGRLAATDKYARAEMFRSAGAAAVVEMPLCGLLLAENVYAFAVTCMLQKLECVQQIAIPFVGGSEALFEAITSFLFDEPPAYQKQMRALRGEGRELRAVLPGVMEQFVPGAGEFLREPMNHMAVEMYNTLRRAYFPAKPFLVRLDAAPQQAKQPPRQDAYLLTALRQAFAAQTDALGWAKNLYSGSERLDARILAALNGDVQGMDALAKQAEMPGVPAMAVRWHLMACLTAYRKVDSFVCIMYNYIPYIRLLGAEDADFLQHLRANVGTTLLTDTPDEKDFSQLTDPAKQLLNAIDSRARALFVNAE